MLQNFGLSCGLVSCPLIIRRFFSVLDPPSACGFRLETQMHSDEILLYLFLSYFRQVLVAIYSVVFVKSKIRQSKIALSQVCHNPFLFFLVLLPLIDTQDSSIFLPHLALL